MSGIRINAAAEMLGVSPSTLRSWERRLGYPQPHRTPGNHRLYELDEVEALREALRETHNISSAVEVARRARPRPRLARPPGHRLRSLRRGRRRPRARGEPRGALGRAHASPSCSCRRSSSPSGAPTAAPSSSTRVAGRPAGSTGLAASPPERPATRGSCCSTRVPRSGSSRSTSRRSSCSCAAPACACCCSPPGSPRAGSAAPCGRSNRPRS